MSRQKCFLQFSFEIKKNYKNFAALGSLILKTEREIKQKFAITVFSVYIIREQFW